MYSSLRLVVKRVFGWSLSLIPNSLLSQGERRRQTHEVCPFLAVIPGEATVASPGMIAQGISQSNLGFAPYCTAMVTVFEATPPMVRTIGTAAPAGTPIGTWTVTW